MKLRTFLILLLSACMPFRRCSSRLRGAYGRGPLRAGIGIGYGYDEPSRRWYFEDSIICESEFDARAAWAQLVAEGRADEFIVIAGDQPFHELPLWVDEYREGKATGKSLHVGSIKKLWNV